MYKRLARCSGSDLAELAHEFLGQMLGAPRTMRHFGSRVLQDAGLIEYPRGHVTIIDRKGLEAVACECRRINFPAQGLLVQFAYLLPKGASIRLLISRIPILCVDRSEIL
jgi:hypothetical protein